MRTPNAPREELQSMYAQLQRDRGSERLPQIIRSLEERSRYRERWIGAHRHIATPCRCMCGLTALARGGARRGARISVSVPIVRFDGPKLPSPSIITDPFTGGGAASTARPSVSPGPASTAPVHEDDSLDLSGPARAQ